MRITPSTLLTAGLLAVSALAAAGCASSTTSPAAAPAAVTHTVTAAPASAPAPARTVIVAPAPAQTVYEPAAPAQAPAGGSTWCNPDGGSQLEVMAGPDTSCPFAMAIYNADPGYDSTIGVYSTVTGETYQVTYNITGGWTYATTATGASVTF